MPHRDVGRESRCFANFGLVAVALAPAHAAQREAIDIGETAPVEVGGGAILGAIPDILLFKAAVRPGKVQLALVAAADDQNHAPSSCRHVQVGQRRQREGLGDGQREARQVAGNAAQGPRGPQHGCGIGQRLHDQDRGAVPQPDPTGDHGRQPDGDDRHALGGGDGQL